MSSMAGSTETVAFPQPGPSQGSEREGLESVKRKGLWEESIKDYGTVKGQTANIFSSVDQVASTVVARARPAQSVVTNGCVCVAIKLC